MTAVSAEFSPGMPEIRSSLQIRQQRLATHIAIASAVVMGISTLVFLLTAVQHHYWHIYLLLFTFGIGFLITTALSTIHKKEYRQNVVLWLALAIIIPLLSLAAVVQNQALTVAFICFLFGTILANGCLQGRNRDIAITISFFSALLTILLGTFSPVEQVRIPLLEVYIPSILGVLVMVYVVLLSMEYITANLRIKLLTISLAIAILPLLVLSLIDTNFIRNSLEKQTYQALRLASEEAATSIDAFLSSTSETTVQHAKLSVFLDYLKLAPNERMDSPEEQAVRLTMDSLTIHQPAFFRSIGILNMQGMVVYDTNYLEKGKSYINEEFYVLTVSTKQPQISSVIFSKDGEDGYINFTSPIRDTRQQLIGVLRIQYDALVLQNILDEKINLVGVRSYPILLDENYLRLADTLTPKSIYRLLAPLPSDSVAFLLRDLRLPNIPIYQMDTGHRAIIPFIENYLTRPMFTIEMHHDDGDHIENGFITRLSNKPWYLVFIQEQKILATLLESQGRLSTLISTLIAGIVGVFATGISSAFSKPIIRLHNTAEKIISGDLNAQAQVESSDEIGSLANAFNNMTQQLKTLIADLESRVLERTQELAAQNEVLIFRGRQLQTVSDVARGIISTQEFEGLLDKVTTLVSERFNFYHVGVFLIDSKGEYAVLRAANSEGGKRMLAHQHKLKIGAVGIVGYVTATGEPRIATDVGQDAVFFNNPDLPQTRSEMALPLKSNQRVIGALDVQSTVPNAFTQEDIELFSTLADQISIAIVNNQLFNDTVRALEESQRIHRQYLRREWTSELASRQSRSFKYSPQGVNPQPDITLPEIQRALESGQVITGQTSEDTPSAVLAVPIKLRGETLGVIHLKDIALPDREWKEDEILAISAIADQAGLALENVRLLEKTMRRAERDRKALEITGKIRATADTKSMIDIALQELRETLKATRAHIILKDDHFTDSSNESLHHAEKAASRAGPK